MNNDELFRELLERHLADALRPGEEKLLEQMVGDPVNEPVLTEFMRETYEETQPGQPGAEWNARFLEGLRRRMEPAHSGGQKVFHLSRWLAAAALVVVLAGAYMLHYVHRSGPAAGRPLKTSEDIGPGKEMAVLTLADGRRIALDSSATDTISGTPGAMVVNLKGKLAFNARPVQGKQTEYNTISTGRGNQYELILPDGTRVWLNAASSLRFPTTFGAGERRVELTGEGYFAVVNDAAHPFTVVCDHMEAKDLGTEFNIMAYPDEPLVEAGLVKGSIAVSAGGRQAVLKDPGNMAVDGPDGMRLVTGDPEQFAAWKNGMISFSNTDLPALLREVSRWYDVDVEYTGEPSLRRFGGLMSRNVRLSAILEILRKTGVNIRQEGRKLIVDPDKKE